MKDSWSNRIWVKAAAIGSGLSIFIMLFSPSADAAKPCSQITPADHLKFGIECVTPSGKIFKRVKYEDFENHSWEDPDGIVWSGVMAATDNTVVDQEKEIYKADQECDDYAGYLPTEEAMYRLLSFFIKNKKSSITKINVSDIDWASYFAIFPNSAHYGFWLRSEESTEEGDSLFFAVPSIVKGEGRYLNEWGNIRQLFGNSDETQKRGVRCMSRDPNPTIEQSAAVLQETVPTKLLEDLKTHECKDVNGDLKDLLPNLSLYYAQKKYIPQAHLKLHRNGFLCFYNQSFGGSSYAFDKEIVIKNGDQISFDGGYGFKGDSEQFKIDPKYPWIYQNMAQDSYRLLPNNGIRAGDLVFFPLVKSNEYLIGKFTGSKGDPDVAHAVAAPEFFIVGIYFDGND